MKSWAFLEAGEIKNGRLVGQGTKPGRVGQKGGNWSAFSKLKMIR